MTFADAMLYLNVTGGGVGFAIYGLWAWKWRGRNAKPEMIANLIAALACLGFAIGYINILSSPHYPQHIQGIFRYLVGLIIGASSVARILEYRRDELRSRYAKQVIQKMRDDVHPR